MKSEQYWSKRMDDLNEALLRKGEAYVDDLNKEYGKAMARLKKETDAWYARLARNNDISMAEARKLLTANELKEFRWTVEDYIKAGRDNAIDQRWMKQLENASAKVHISRLEEMQMKIQQEAELLAAKRLQGTTATLADVYKDGYYHGVYEVQKGIGKGVPVAALDHRQIDKVLAKPWAPDGRNFSDRIWADKTKLASELQTTLTQSLINGSPSEKVIAAFADRMGVSYHAAARLIRTESAYFANQSMLDGYKDMGVQRYKIIATLDSKTSEICREMDGKVIPLSEADPGVNYPPLHVNCRSTTIPVYDDETQGERTARNPEGKTYSVPGDMTYKEWADKHAPDATKPVKEPDIPKPVEPAPVKTVEPETIEPVKRPDKPVTPTPPEPPKPPALTKDEESAVVRYIGGESFKLNEKLRKSVPLNNQEMTWVEQLDKALDKLPRYQGDLTRSLFFKTVEEISDFTRDFKPGAVIQYPQYISTTAGAIYNPSGQVHFYILGAAMGADLTEMNPNELEVLYGRDFPFEVLEIEIINGVYHILLRELRK